MSNEPQGTGNTAAMGATAAQPTETPERKDEDHPVQPALKVVDRRWWVTGETAAEGDQEWHPRKPTYIEQLEQQLADKDRLLQDHIARYKAAAGEFDAARVRFRRDVAKEVERGKRAILAELLDVVDNLDRAIEAARRSSHRGTEPHGGSALAALLQGVEMVRDQFLARLEGFGVKRMDAVGQKFDPSLHEAVTTIPTTDPTRDGVIAGVIREGYRIGDEVLRPASVAVARLPES